MPRAFKFENKTYTLPDGTSDQEALDFLSAQHPAVDMSPHNVGTDTQGEGFFAHAGKTLRDLPDAFLSGRVLSDPVQALGQSMQDQINNPSLHHALRAIPGVGMAEDALAAPARTAASGDVPGAFGDAADTALQMLLLHRGGARVSEPLQRMQTTAPTGGLPELPSMVKTGAHFSPKTAALMKIYETARKMGVGDDGGESRIFGPPMDLSTSERPSFAPSALPQGMGSGLGASPATVPPLNPVEVPAQTPSGRPPGSLQRVRALGLDLPAPPGPQLPPRVPAWQQMGINDAATPAQSDTSPIYPYGNMLPSGRSAGPAITPAIESTPLPTVTAKVKPVVRPPRVPGWQNLTGVEPSTPAVPPVPVTDAPAPLASSAEQSLPGGHAVSLTMPPDTPDHYAAYGADRGAAQLVTALAKDRSLIQHFEGQGVTAEQFKSADQQQRNRWLADANKGLGKKYKPYQGDAGESSAQRLLQTWGTGSGK